MTHCCGEVKLAVGLPMLGASGRRWPDQVEPEDEECKD
jgi:hypothetical protein